MQVNSVSLASQNFEGKGKAQKKQVIITPEQFANMSDRDLKVLAQITASNQVNDKKHNKLNKMMYYNLPIAGGLADLAGAAKGSRLGKLGLFAGSVLGWGAGLFAIDTMLKGKHAIEKRSSKVRDFNEKHPILSTGLTIGGLFAGLVYGGRSLSKLAGKVLPKLEKSGLYAKHAPVVTAKVKSFGKILDNNKLLNNLSGLVAKVPSSIKSIGKQVALNAPFILVIGQLAHAFNHKSVRQRVAMNNFAELKAAQADIRNQIEQADANVGII